MKKQSSDTLISLELARGLAALMIFVFHFIQLGQQRYGAFHFDAVPWIPFMAGGVDLFFLLSGFLMVHTTQTPPNRKALPFLLKRFIRIFPAYWLILGGQIIVLLQKPEWFHNLSAMHPSILHSVFLLPHHTPTILMVAWTLVYEMYFYLVFAATLFLPRRQQFITLVLFFIICSSLGWFFPSEDKTLQLVTSPLLLEFTAGMALAMLWPALPRARFLPVLYLSVATLWLLAGVFPQDNRLLSSGVPYVLIFMTFLTLEKQHIRLPTRTALFLGGISYTLYLIHAPVISAMPVLANVLHSKIPLPYFLIPVFFTSLIGAIVLHYWFEIPVQRRLRQWCGLRNRPPQTIPLHDIVAD